jgi:hypothetical protein
VKAPAAQDRRLIADAGEQFADQPRFAHAGLSKQAE